MSRSADFLLTPGAEEPAPAGGIPALTWVELRGFEPLTPSMRTAGRAVGHGR